MNYKMYMLHQNSHISIHNIFVQWNLVCFSLGLELRHIYKGWNKKLLKSLKLMISSFWRCYIWNILLNLMRTRIVTLIKFSKFAPRNKYFVPKFFINIFHKKITRTDNIQGVPYHIRSSMGLNLRRLNHL